MNKKLIAAAVAVAFAAPAAYADATLYGKLHTSIDKNDFETFGMDNWTVTSRSSRLGVKGSEDLGGGLKAIYQFETGISSDGDGGPFQGQRNTFIGLSGGFGTFLVGRHDTPAKVAFYAAGNERLGDSVIDLNRRSALTSGNSSNNPIGVFHEFRTSDGIAYISPNFSGFTFAGAIVPGEQAGTTSGNDQNDGLADHYSLGLMYKGGGLKASAGYNSYSDPTGTALSEDITMWQAGATYTFGAFSIGAQYEDTSDLAFVDGVDYTAWALTGKATFGNNAISLVYTDSETESAAGDVDTKGWGIAAEHNFSKRTKVYAAYADNETDGPAALAVDADDDVFSLGMIHNF